ncbi:mechanosensitive ion channel family protein [Phyllobacterium sp. CCNWLW109]|uniref:mechanosensitive ion channel family protein n=1 Tax=Phyllobacterium sp. CCNWLW109 TaxID=3127479 RepID=UPI003077344B
MVPGSSRINIAAVHILLILVLAMLPQTVRLANAQTNSPAQQGEKIDQLLKLLEDPDVKSWIAAKPNVMPQDDGKELSTSAVMTWAHGIRSHLRDMVHAIPAAPGELARADDKINTILNGYGFGSVLALFAGFAGLGYGVETAFRRFALGRSGPTFSAGDLPAPAETIAASAFFGLAPLVIFAIVSVGGFLFFNWPPLLAALVVPMLAALIVWRFILKIAGALLAPGNETRRLIATDGRRARFWYKRVAWFAGIFFTGWAAAAAMKALAFAPEVQSLLVYTIGLGLLVIALETIWHRPDRSTGPEAHRIKEWGLTFYVCLLWVLWVAGLSLTMWIGIYILILPPLLRTTTNLVQQLFTRPLDRANQKNTLFEVLVERGARLVVIVLAVAWLGVVARARAIGLMEDETAKQVVRGVVGGAVIVLAADLVWHVVKGLINRRIEKARLEAGDEAELARSGRLMTLLPILRNFLAAFIIAVALMMILSGLGIEIGPLIAGAGIFGVAIGFGSQTLVKDVISGVFYMTDDAFRVGEYIQSGSYKGTVESFSIRSVKLRHHRGPVFTVPFGSLGAVQNMSRDWVIDKFLISVNYDTDIAKVKKVVKGVGATLLEEPELGPHIIETVKMKGVETFGDYGINLSFAMMTKPGHQSTIRRRAYAMIREAFAANGIGFASPTVQVAGQEDQSTGALAAATQNTLARKKAADTLKLVEDEG